MSELEGWDLPLSAVLFHGTQHEFNPGDVITPQSKKVAFATRNPKVAKKFSANLKTGETGRVYKVEPVSHDPMDVWERPMKYGSGASEVVSTKGFKVIQEHKPKTRKPKNG